MCHFTAVAELPESSIWRGKLSAEEAEQARQRHRALVEAWLDFASFADELFKLHKKYHVANGEAGYVAYRQYLKKQEEKYLADYGLTADPLNEGCQCIFCISHPEKKSATSPSSPEPQEHGKVRCAEQSNDRRVEHGPHSGPYDLPDRGKKKRHWAPRAETKPMDLNQPTRGHASTLLPPPPNAESQKKRRACCLGETKNRRVEHGRHGGPYGLPDRGKKMTRRNPYRNVSQIRVRGSPPTCQKKLASAEKLSQGIFGCVL